MIERDWKRDQKWARTREIGRLRGREVAKLESKETGESDTEDKTGNTSGIRKSMKARENEREKSRLGIIKREGLTVSES